MQCRRLPAASLRRSWRTRRNGAQWPPIIKGACSFSPPPNAAANGSRPRRASPGRIQRSAGRAMPMNWSSLPILVAGWASGERANVLGMGAEKVSGSIFFFRERKKIQKIPLRYGVYDVRRVQCVIYRPCNAFYKKY